ncbi:hypothetical protein OCD64_13165 [Bacillus toyonensis]|uniref:deaminase domain-containing protein n=1 Tax=Bacillus toyonensis TaxID=155322 RepID=UPI0021CFF567|nr:deaminase domain-containing protein [Bacillus toyonensis]MCU4967924.1 hypothetical protein [Bacillus toyonensis]
MGQCLKIKYDKSIPVAARLKKEAESRIEKALNSTSFKKLSRKQIRQRENLYNEKKNVAAIIYDDTILVAHSSVSGKGNIYHPFFVLETEGRYPFTDVKVSPFKEINTEDGWERQKDCEAKLLIYLAKTVLKMNASGKIDLYTKFEPCLGCDNYIIQFLKLFKDIDINIYWEYPYPSIKKYDDFNRAKRLRFMSKSREV